MTMNTNENKIQIGKHAYEAPCLERVQVETEGDFAASQPVTGNNQNGVLLDGWSKTTGSDADTWSDS